MAEQKKVTFISKHAGLTISREPIWVRRMVGGRPTEVQVTPKPLKFDNFRLKVDSDDEEALELLRDHRLNPSFFEEQEEEEIPEAVKKEIEGKEEEPEEKEPETVTSEEVTDSNDDGEVTVEDVTNINQAKDYLINECGVDGRTINTPPKIKKAIAEQGVKFPNLELS